MKQFEGITGHALKDQYFSTAARNQFVLHFMQNFQGTNLQANRLELDIRGRLEDVVIDASNIIGAATNQNIEVVWLDNSHVSICNNKLQFFSNYCQYNQYPNEEDCPPISKINSFEFEVYAEPALLSKVVSQLSALYAHQNIVKITWCFSAGGRVESKQLYIENKLKMYDEFYPWFENGVNSFITEYLDDEAAVLVLHGEPGTGKTSFLRHLLVNYKKNAMVSYDEKVLSDDRFFIQFLTTNESNLLIVEDADKLLGDRQQDQNEVMSKFLNVSDGIVKISDKKLIFTTNISQISKIDQALIRQGRCFATVEFRNLSAKEAEIAGAAAGLTDRDWSVKRSWSIAEMFNKKTENVVAQKITKLGIQKD